jgi:hypothetical protein
VKPNRVRDGKLDLSIYASGKPQKVRADDGIDGYEASPGNGRLKLILAKKMTMATGEADEVT